LTHSNDGRRLIQSKSPKLSPAVETQKLPAPR
jgi:hypothetical protein